MGLQRVRDAMEQAFFRDVAEGTVEIEEEAALVTLNGGNWLLTVRQNGVNLDLPMNDPNYYDDNSDTFLDNVLGAEVEQSLRVLDAKMDGGLIRGLLESGDVWSIRLGERLSEAASTTG